MRSVLAFAILLTLMVVAGSPGPAASQTAERVGVLIVLDVSGSMSESDGAGTIKMEGARSGISDLLQATPSTLPIGIYTFPTQGQECGAGKGLVEVKAGISAVDAINTLGAISPDGGTPTHDALLAAADDFPDWVTRPVMVLVSDGESNCGPDPCVAANHLVGEGYDLQIHTVGFRIDPNGEEELKCISQATGGTYADVSDSDELAEELEELVEPRFGLTFNSNGPYDASVQQAFATVSNDGLGDAASNVTLTLTSGRNVTILDSTRRLGNLPPGGKAPDQMWEISVPATCETSAVGLTLTLLSDNTEPRTIVHEVPVEADPESILCNLTKDNTVVLGDSYSSGEGAPPFDAGTDRPLQRCHRGDTYARQGIDDEVAVIACSGAIAAELFTPNFGSIDPVYTPDLESFDPGIEQRLRSQVSQLLDLDPRPDYVFLTIGGNDAGFVILVTHCVLEDGCQKRRLEEARDPFGGDAFGEGDLGDGEGILNATQFIAWRLNALRETQPEALRFLDQLTNGEFPSDPIQFIVPAYPQLLPPAEYFPEDADQCPLGVGWAGRVVAADEISTINSFVSGLNVATSRSIGIMRNEGRPFHFIEMTEAALAGHSLCDGDSFAVELQLGPRSAPTIDGDQIEYETEYTGRLSLHPNTQGYEAMWSIIEQELSRTAPFERTATDSRPITDICTLDDANTYRMGVDLDEPFNPGDCVLLISKVDGGQTEIEFLMQSTLRVLARAQVDEFGEARAMVRIPDEVELGDHTLMAVGFDENGDLVAGTQAISVVRRTPLRYWASLIGFFVLLIIGGVLMRSKPSATDLASDHSVDSSE